MSAERPVPVWVVDTINSEWDAWENVKAQFGPDRHEFHRACGALDALEILFDALREEIESPT